MQLFSAFKQRLRAELWPSGEARSLRPSHDSFFNAAMMDIQKWVPCVRQHNVSTWLFADTYWDNAKTVVNAPWGKIKRVYTVAGGLDRWRDKVRYRSSNFEEIQCWSNRLFNAITPTNTGLPALSLGVRYAHESQDSTLGRARIGSWAVDRKRLYVAPYLQSSEMLVVDWDGLKPKWLDSDGVDDTYWTTDYEEAIKYFVQFRHEFSYGDRSIAKDAKALYDAALADLIHTCRENTKQQHDYTCDASSGGEGFVGLQTPGGSGSGGGDATDDDDDPTEDTTDEDNVLFVAVGDMGDPTEDAADVAAAIESDNPELFIALGDNSYGGTYEDDFGVNYQDFVDAETVLPVPGNHDYSDHSNSLDDYEAYFGDLAVNEKVVGPIHFIAYDTDALNPDGIGAGSIQLERILAKAYLSVARWKILIMHRPPYSSDTTHGSDAALQADFSAFDLVLCAHAHGYERLEVSGVPYIVVGTGGRALYSYGAPISGSQIIVAGKFGRLIGNANCDELVLEFKDVDNVVLDTLTITKE